MTRRTPGQAHARRVLCALARTALDVCDLRAEAGLEDDDRPRMWLTALERWTHDEATPKELATATRAVRAWQSGHHDDDAGEWWCAVDVTADASEDIRRYPTHASPQEARAIRRLSLVLVSLGEDSGAATARVRRIYDNHLRDVGRDAAEAVAAARLRQSRDDRAEAERVLWTVRP